VTPALLTELVCANVAATDDHVVAVRRVADGSTNVKEARTILAAAYRSPRTH
jgi:hypothetical protein